MFGVDSGELFIIVLVAVMVIGPKELPRVLRTVGQWVGRARGMANQFRAGVNQMVRDTEIADLEKKWREQNEAIMRANPLAPADSGWGLPDPPPVSPVSTVAPASPGSAAVAPAVGKLVSLDKPVDDVPAPPHPIEPSFPTPRRRPGESGS